MKFYFFILFLSLGATAFQGEIAYGCGSSEACAGQGHSCPENGKIMGMSSEELFSKIDTSSDGMIDKNEFAVHHKGHHHGSHNTEGKAVQGKPQ